MDAVNSYAIEAHTQMTEAADPVEILQARLRTVQRHLSDFRAVQDECRMVVAAANGNDDAVAGALKRFEGAFEEWTGVASDVERRYQLNTIGPDLSYLSVAVADQLYTIAGLLNQASARLAKEPPRPPGSQSSMALRVQSLGLYAIVMNLIYSMFLIIHTLKLNLPTFSNRMSDVGHANVVPLDRRTVDKADQGAERQRRLRQRKRLGIIGQVPVNLFRSDVAMLRTLGFLAAGEADDREAQARAVENFIAASMLGRIDPWIPRTSLMDSQRGRLIQLGILDDPDFKDDATS